MDQSLIITGCKKGERWAQKSLFEIYSKGMLALCKRYVKDGKDAEELLLNGFYKAYTNIDRFVYTDDKGTGAWLKKIMVNECLMFLRNNSKIIFITDESEVDAIPDEQIIGKMNVDDILKLISTLPAGYRIVFNMYVIEGYDHREIADHLQITEGASRSQLSRAKAAIQKLLVQNRAVYEAG